MPEAPAAPPPSAPASAPTPGPGIESAPKVSLDPFPNIDAEIGDMIGKSGLGTPENEARVGKGRRPGKVKADDKPPETKPPEQKPGDKPPEQKPAEKPAEKPPEQKPPEQKPADQKPPDKPPEEKAQGPWQRVHAAERKIKELEARLQERESQKPPDDPEKLEFKTKYESAEKARKALDDEMRFLNYERSTEFQEQHYKPYVAKWERAIAQVKDLKIMDDAGNVRAATADDLSKIVQMGSNEEALEAAEALFKNPAKAAYVMTLRNQLRDAHHTMEGAKAEFRAKGDERQKEWERQQSEQQAQETEQQKYYTDLWGKMNEAAIEQHKDWFVAPEDDAEGAELLRKGFELADLAWNGSEKLDPEKLIALRSAERNKAAGFRYQVHLNAKLKSRVAELEKEIADYRGSEPGPGEGKKGDEKSVDDIDAAIARIPRA